MRCTRITLAALLAATIQASPALAVSTTAVTTVNIVKPVSLSKLQDMDFGTLTVGGFTGTRTLTISQAGVFACAAEVVCSGAPKPARFNIQGTNKLSPRITVSGGNLSNGTDTIPFTADAPASIYLPNSGAPGVDFAIGGSIVVSGALSEGVYTGTLNVTADY